jgi:hypothetical protein
MKISFPKYGPIELLIQKQGVGRIISLAAIVFFAGVCGSYLLANKLWLLTIALLGIAGILLFLGAAAAIFLNQSKVNEPPGAPIEENVPELTPQWNYRPRKPIRARGVLHSPSTETSDDLSSDSFGISDSAWFNDNSLESVAPTFFDGAVEAEELITEGLTQPTDTVSAVPAADDAAVRGTTKVL